MAKALEIYANMTEQRIKWGEGLNHSYFAVEDEPYAASIPKTESKQRRSVYTEKQDRGEDNRENLVGKNKF